MSIREERQGRLGGFRLMSFPALFPNHQAGEF